METAVAAVRNGLSVRKAAAKFDLPKSTLSDRLTGKKDIDTKNGRKPVLDPAVEKKIVDNITLNAEKGFGQQLLTRTGLQ